MTRRTPQPTSLPATELIVGVGSPHGDDRAGWAVIDRLHELRLAAGPQTSQPLLRKAAVPHDLLDWLQPDIPTHLIDASAASQPYVSYWSITQSSPGGLQLSGGRSFEQPRATRRDAFNPEPGCWSDLPSGQPLSLSTLRSQGSHQLGVWQVLQLASILGQMPSVCHLWILATEDCTPAAELTPTTQLAVEHCAAALLLNVFAQSAGGATAALAPYPWIQTTRRQST